VRYGQLMKIPAGFKLLLTGTPLQNNLQELASLLSFILPEFFEEVVEDLHYIFKAKATTRDTDHAALLSAQRIARARSMLTPFILRRKKHQVLKHLPPKTLRVEHCNLHPDQAKIYNGHLDQARERARIAKEGGKALKAENDENNPLMQLRKAAIHHLLFRRYFTNEKIEKMADILRAKAVKEFRSDKNHQRHHLISEMRGLSDFTLHYWCGQYPCIASFDIPGLPWMDSGKVEAMIKLVKKYKQNGDRVLIFSQFQLALDILEAVLNTSGIFYTRIDGSTKIEERQSLIDTFTKDTSITAFLLTTKAGGTGLNLMAANKVIIFDGSFNPHDDKQAEDRAHRVGQEREVEVVRLVTRDTIEEQIYALGVSKLTLDGRVSGDDEATAKAAQERGEKEVMRMFVEGVKAIDDGTKPTIEGAKWVDVDEDEKKKEAKPAAADDTKKDDPLPLRKRKSSLLDTITRKSSRQKDSKIIVVDEESDEMLV
jgi:SWI/SNF-related matrix-associated actin-dependent regulator 1 of chromatin subfamily A